MSDTYGSEKSGSGSTPSEGSGSDFSSAGSDGSAGSEGCAYTVTGITLHADLMSGFFTVTNTGTVDLLLVDVLQGMGGPTYDFVLFVGGATITPGNAATVEVSTPSDMRATTFELVTDCSNTIGEWPIS